MIVPSRSIKTAAANSLATFGILSKTGDQFIARYSRCSKLAYDHCARVVGDFRRFGRSRSAGKAESKESDGRITCARYVENLSCFGWDIVGCFFLLEKHHALFAESDQDMFCFPFFQQRFASALLLSIVARQNIKISCADAFGGISF